MELHVHIILLELFSFTCVIDIFFYEKVQKLKKWYSNELPYNIMLFTSLLVIAYDNDTSEPECIFSNIQRLF